MEKLVLEEYQGKIMKRFGQRFTFEQPAIKLRKYMTKIKLSEESEYTEKDEKLYMKEKAQKSSDFVA